MRPVIFDRRSARSRMARLMQSLPRLAATELPLLVRGESGVGKEALAREAHRLSARAAGPFVALDVAAIPTGLLDGIRKAHGGTLYLDGIGELPREMQAELLRVLREAPLPFRLICATPRDLDGLVAAQLFRRELQVLIDGATLRVPPLRERPEDLALLCAGMLERLAPGRQLAPDAIARLQQHSWPGNVRELEQVLARTVALDDAAMIGADALAFSSEVPRPESAEDLATLRQALKEFTRGYIRRAMRVCAGDRVATARVLGVSERTFYRMLASGARVRRSAP